MKELNKPKNKIRVKKETKSNSSSRPLTVLEKILKALKIKPSIDSGNKSKSDLRSRKDLTDSKAERKKFSMGERKQIHDNTTEESFLDEFINIMSNSATSNDRVVKQDYTTMEGVTLTPKIAGYNYSSYQSTNSNKVVSPTRSLPEPILSKRTILTKDKEEDISDLESIPQSTENQYSNIIKPTRVNSKVRRRAFTYLEPVTHVKGRRKPLQPVVEIKAERVIARRPIMETVSDINSVKLGDRINLVTHFNDKKSGRLYERESQRTHTQNTKAMVRYYTLTDFLKESCVRALELHGVDHCIIQVDSKDRDILDEVLSDSNLSSYEFEIIHENKILSRLAVEPVYLRAKLKLIQ